MITCFGMGPNLSQRLKMRHWSRSNSPTLKELENDLRRLFLLEKINAETQPNKGITAYIKRWRQYIIHTFNDTTIQNIMKPFQLTMSYAIVDLTPWPDYAYLIRSTSLDRVYWYNYSVSISI